MLRRHSRRVNESQAVGAFQQDGCGARQTLRNVYTNKGVNDKSILILIFLSVGFAAIGSYSSA
jgi:hypothetical protein